MSGLDLDHDCLQRVEELSNSPEIQSFADELTDFAERDCSSHEWTDGRSASRKSFFDSFEQKLMQSSDCQADKDVFLATLHRRVVESLLTEMIELLGSDATQRVVSVLANGVSNKSPLSKEEVEFVEWYRKSACNLISALGYFGFDRPLEEFKSSPLKRPFEDIDCRNPVWRRNFEVAENFGHALVKLFDLQGLMFYLDLAVEYLEGEDFCEAESCLRKLQVFFQEPMSSVLAIFRNFRTIISQKEGEENDVVEVVSMLKDLKLLLRARFGLEFKMENLPVEFQTKGSDLILENADRDGLLLAVFEIVKNAFRSDKVSIDQLVKYGESGGSYLTVNAGEALLNGKEVVAIEISDKGTQIDVHAIIERMGDLLKGWGARDITFGQMLDYLSVRHVSIPLKGADGVSGKMSTGIGLHSARSVIRAHNGEIFPVNLKEGVSFLIIIPKEGKGADWSVSEEKVTGAKCGEISEKVAAAQCYFRKAVGRIFDRDKDCSRGDLRIPPEDASFMVPKTRRKVKDCGVFVYG